MPTRRLFLAAIASINLLSVSACGGDSPGGADAGTADATGTIDAAGGCDVTSVLPQQWRVIDLKAAGAITAQVAGTTTTAAIDGTAGGTAAAADNPYLYVDLATGTKVAISDLDALTSTAWDLAFKRASIRINGGDSGSGGVTVASVAAATLAEVTTSPADAAFATDDWASADCMFNALPAGEPATAFGEWYDYDAAAHTLTPKANVYVVKTHGGSKIKLRITTYYGNQASPMAGANYRVEWTPL